MRPADTQLAKGPSSSKPEGVMAEFWDTINRMCYLEATELGADIVAVAEGRGWQMVDKRGLAIDGDDLASLLCDMAGAACDPA